MDPHRRETVRRILRAAAPKGADPLGFDRAVWRQTWGLGLDRFGLAAPQADGRDGIDTTALCLLAEELGAALRPEPVIPAVMAARLLPADRLPSVLTGERIVVPAWQECADSLETAGATTLRGRRLSGRKIHVPTAPEADAFVVTLPDGVALVERDAGGLSLEIAGPDDGLHVGSLVLDGVPAEHLPGNASAALDEAILASAAYLLGSADRAAAVARDVLASRRHLTRQPRVIEAQRQQRMDEIAMQLALTRTAVSSAIATLSTAPHAAVRGSLVSKAWLRAVNATLMVTRTCVQLVAVQALPGVAELQRFQRRALAMSTLYGSPTVHRARFYVAPDPGRDGTT